MYKLDFSPDAGTPEGKKSSRKLVLQEQRCRYPPCLSLSQKFMPYITVDVTPKTGGGRCFHGYLRNALNKGGPYNIGQREGENNAMWRMG